MVIAHHPDANIDKITAGAPFDVEGKPVDPWCCFPWFAALPA